MARNKPTRAASTAVVTRELAAEQHVGTHVRRITEAMTTYSRTMLAGAMATPFDALKSNSGVPTVGSIGPQSTGYFQPPLTRLSRHLDRNDSFIRQGLDIRADATVNTGPWPEFANAGLNDLWEEWVNDCDKRRKMSFAAIAKKLRRNVWSSGESFMLMYDEPMTSDRVVPLAIKGIELDHVDAYDNRINPANGNRIISGIELDDDDAPVAIWVLPYHPHDMHIMSRWAPSVRTPIADICHLMDETDFSSIRGIPLIAPAIMKTINTTKFENATAARMIASTLFTGWAKQTDRSAGGAQMPGQQEVDDWVSEILVEPGAFNVLPYGVEVDFTSPPESGNTYEAYVRMAHRYAAATMGVLYQEMTGDWENATDRIHRAATLSISRRIDIDRATDEHKVWRKLARRFVDRAYLSGAWRPTEGMPQREWYTHEWKWPAKRYQNLYQEFNAYSMAIEKRLMDRPTAVGELFGLDARKVDREQAKADARVAALSAGPAADIIRQEVEADEMEFAQSFAESDDDAVGLRQPMSKTKATRR